MRSTIFIGILLFAFTTALVPQSKQTDEQRTVKPKITFVELGSVNCIPCKKMQPVMKAIEQKYGDVVKVIFYDVWTQEQKPFAQQYGIRLIPTQVFLDENGKEFFRHEGFFPEEEIHKIFKKRGVTPAQIGG
jgi:thioredoxin 1